MEDIVKLLRSGVMDTGVLISSAAKINAIMEIGASEIESLRAQLAEARREVDFQVQDNCQLQDQFLATQAHAEGLAKELREAIETIQWMRGCTSPADDEVEKAVLRGNAALSTPINLDALHEDRARECERLKREWTPAKGFSGETWLNEEAAAHRAKKEAV